MFEYWFRRSLKFRRILIIIGLGGIVYLYSYVDTNNKLSLPVHHDGTIIHDLNSDLYYKISDKQLSVFDSIFAVISHGYSRDDIVYANKQDMEYPITERITVKKHSLFKVKNLEGYTYYLVSELEPVITVSEVNQFVLDYLNIPETRFQEVSDISQIGEIGDVYQNLSNHPYGLLVEIEDKVYLTSEDGLRRVSSSLILESYGFTQDEVITESEVDYLNISSGVDLNIREGVFVLSSHPNPYIIDYVNGKVTKRAYAKDSLWQALGYSRDSFISSINDNLPSLNSKAISFKNININNTAPVASIDFDSYNNEYVSSSLDTDGVIEDMYWIVDSKIHYEEKFKGFGSNIKLVVFDNHGFVSTSEINK